MKQKPLNRIIDALVREQHLYVYDVRICLIFLLLVCAIVFTNFLFIAFVLLYSRAACEFLKKKRKPFLVVQNHRRVLSFHSFVRISLVCHRLLDMKHIVWYVSASFDLKWCCCCCCRGCCRWCNWYRWPWKWANFILSRKKLCNISFVIII